MSASAAEKKEFVSGQLERALTLEAWPEDHWMPILQTEGKDKVAELQDGFEQALNACRSAVSLSARFEAAQKLDVTMQGLSKELKVAARTLLGRKAASVAEVEKADKVAEPPKAAGAGKGKASAESEPLDSPSKNTRSAGKGTADGASGEGNSKGASKRTASEALPSVPKAQKKLVLEKDVQQTVEIDDDDDTGENATPVVTKVKQPAGVRAVGGAEGAEAAKLQQCMRKLAEQTMSVLGGGSKQFGWALGASTLGAVVHSVASLIAGKSPEERRLYCQAFFLAVVKIEKAFPRDAVNLKELESLEQLDKVWKTWLDYQSAQTAGAELAVFGGESKEDAEDEKQASLTARFKAAFKNVKPAASSAADPSHKGGGGRKSEEARPCGYCKEFGHYSRSCPSKPKDGYASGGRYGGAGKEKRQGTGWEGRKTKFED